MRVKRILFLAEGATMAHFVRLLALAEALDNTQYDIHFYAPVSFSGHLRNKPFSIGELHTMPGERFLRNIAKGSPMFPADVLREYVKQDRELIRNLKPDLVVGDMRLSLPISARLEGTMYAVMINAYWSPYAKRRSIIPELPLTRIIPPKLLGPAYKFTEPLAYALHVRQMNRVRKEFGIATLAPDLRAMYTDGDHVLYADVPEFVPTSGLPKNHHYVGICQWTPATPKPEWWESMLRDAKPKVFVSLGSSGPVKVLPALLKALSNLPVSVVLATSGREMAAASATYAAGLLPFTETAATSSVVVSHGGSGGLYPAIAAGTPVLGIPSNADQHLSTAFLKDSGAGLGVRVEEASEGRLQRALERLLAEPRFKQAAERWQSIYARYDSSVLFRKFVAAVLGDGREKRVEDS
jgi:UDP:flavonoid glycosyltransferase YjiC (YdhE family)